MEWIDEGIVLGVRRHGEGAAIVELMTPDHGRHLGLVRGGSGSRLRPVLQPGNRVSATWRARLDEHLGHYQVEGIDLTAASLFAAGYAVYGVTHLGALCRLLPERDPHPEIYARSNEVLGCLLDASWPARRWSRFEMQLLAELGFGLDLSQCAVDGRPRDLCFVSPESGRAVSRAGRTSLAGPDAAPAAVPARFRRSRLTQPTTGRRLHTHGLLPGAPCTRAARADAHR